MAEKQRRPGSGGARIGSGAKKKKEVKKTYQVMLYPSIAEPLIEMYGSLAEIITKRHLHLAAHGIIPPRKRPE